MTLTKADIVKKLEAEFGLKREKSFDMVDTVLEIMKRTMEFSCKWLVTVKCSGSLRDRMNSNS